MTTFNQPSPVQDGSPLLYDPSQVSVAWKGTNLLGFAPGTFIEIERAEDSWKTFVGCTGAVARARTRNDTGVATLHILAQHPTADQLIAIAFADMSTWQQVGPFTLKDAGDKMAVFSTMAWLTRPPKITRSQTSDILTFTFALQALVVSPNGALQALTDTLSALNTILHPN